MSVTAKVKLNRAKEAGDGQTTLEFVADYNDERNKEWAKYTPALMFNMVVLDSVAEQFELGGAYTVTFEPSDEDGGA